MRTMCSCDHKGGTMDIEAMSNARKTAKKWLDDHKTLRNLLERCEHKAPISCEKLVEDVHAQIVKLSGNSVGAAEKG